MFITPAFAQGVSSSQEPGMLVTLAPFLLMILIMYFLILRPQQQRVKKHRAMVSGIKVGDVVTTSGGIVGKVSKVIDDSFVSVQIASSVEVQIARHMISDLLNDENVKFLDEKSEASRNTKRPKSKNRRGKQSKNDDSSDAAEAQDSASASDSSDAEVINEATNNAETPEIEEKK